MAQSSSIKCLAKASELVPARTVYVSQNVWEYLLFVSEYIHTDSKRKIVVSIRPEGCSTWADGSHAYIAWACCPRSTTPVAPHGILLSKEEWLTRRRTLDDDGFNAILTIVSAVPLSTVTLVASDPRSYEISMENIGSVELWLSKGERILGLHDVVRGVVDEGLIKDVANTVIKPTLTLTVGLTEPTSQGFVCDTTRFFIMPANALSVDSAQQTNAEIEFIDEVLLIDENFLGSSVPSERAGTTLSSSPLNMFSSSLRQRKDYDKSIGADTLVIAPMPKQMVFWDSDHTIYTYTDALGKLGVFNEDWILVSTPEGSSRLVRLCAVQDGRFNNDKIYASATFIRNCSLVNSVECLLRIDAQHFGLKCPPIPTASSVTLARIASPLSLDKSLQSAIIHSVRHYFEAERRLLKKGDILSVLLNIDSSLLSDDIVDDLPGGGDIDGHSNRIVPRSCHVYFLVTNLVHEISCNGSAGTTELDTFAIANSGELGCWIDIPITRVVQTGVEHLLAPSMPQATAGRLAEQASIPSSQQVYEFASAVLGESAIRLDLDMTFLLVGSAGSNMDIATRQVADTLGIHVIEVNAYDIIDDSISKTGVHLREQFGLAISCSPCIILMRNMEAFSRSTQSELNDSTIIAVFSELRRQLAAHWRRTGFPVLVVGTVDDVGRLPSPLTAIFKHNIAFELPTELLRTDILRMLLRAVCPISDELVKDIAMQTAGFSETDIINLASRSWESALRRYRDAPLAADKDFDVTPLAGFSVSEDDLIAAVDGARKAFAQSVGAPSIPNVSWDDVGGLIDVKKEILDTIQLPLERPELFADGLKQRSGVLLYGPPGTGKTLLAKAVATTCTLNFLSVKGPEVLNMYIGESEANVRRLFQRAREAKPCVIFFDELDSLAPKRGNHGDSGGVMDRIVSQLLAELDGMAASTNSGGVFVIGATNRPDLLDPALLRPGRFDRLIYLGVSNTHEAQLSIIEALTRKFRLHPELDLRVVAEQCPLNYTGADFYALCSDAMLKAMSRTAQGVERSINLLYEQDGKKITPQYYLSELALPSETDVLVCYEDFQDALRELVASVSQSELEHYSRIQNRFAKELGKDV